MLTLRLGFPGGRYCAASHANETEPEWPPHPSRVYSALVASAYQRAGQFDGPVRDALLWFEQAGAPDIWCPKADLELAPTTFVPVNDLHSRLDKKNPQHPAYPLRQPLFFPQAYLLGKPQVTYGWKSDVPAEVLAALDTIARQVTHVGTSHAMVCAQFSDSWPEEAPTLEPSPRGRLFLRVPVGGRLAELDAIHRLSALSPVRRPTGSCEPLQPYTTARSKLFSEGGISSHDLFVMRLMALPWGADTAHTLARSVRSAVMAAIGDDAPAEIHGHAPDVPHALWLPLPDVGHRHARGRVLGVAIGLPVSMAAAARSAVLRALGSLPFVALPGGRHTHLAALDADAQIPVALRTSVWTAQSHHWFTVTPVVLDRPPKKRTDAAMAQAVAQSLHIAGFPEPQSIRTSSVSDFEGAPNSADVPVTIPRIHARVSFHESVRGPVVAGRLRHFGIGLFRPTPDEVQS